MGGSLLNTSPSDFEMINTYLKHLNSKYVKDELLTPDGEEKMAQIYVKLRDLLEALWPQITAVAKALLERQTLTKDEVLHVLKAHSDQHGPSSQDVAG
jgi:hypothetical protein